MSRLIVGDYLVTCHDGVLKLHNTLRNTLLCLRAPDLDLLLELLDGVSWERRRAARIPVTDNSDLKVSLEIEGCDYRVTPIDISKSGILVSFTSPQPMSFDLTRDLLVKIQFRDRHAQVWGAVRRIDGRSMGIGFRIDLSKPDSIEEAGLAAVMDELESNWLEQRIFGRTNGEATPRL